LHVKSHAESPLNDPKLAAQVISPDRPGTLLTTLLLPASLAAVELGNFPYPWVRRGEQGGRSLDVFAGEA
jgi:hypothetical protein